MDEDREEHDRHPGHQVDDRSSARDPMRAAITRNDGRIVTGIPNSRSEAFAPHDGPPAESSGQRAQLPSADERRSTSQGGCRPPRLTGLLGDLVTSVGGAPGYDQLNVGGGGGDRGDPRPGRIRERPAARIGRRQPGGLRGRSPPQRVPPTPSSLCPLRRSAARSYTRVDHRSFPAHRTRRTAVWPGVLPTTKVGS